MIRNESRHFERILIPLTYCKFRNESRRKFYKVIQDSNLYNLTKETGLQENIILTLFHIKNDISTVKNVTVHGTPN